MDTKQEERPQPHTADLPLAHEPPLGKALFRVMRAMVFDDTPLPELDALPMAQLRLLWSVQHGAGATMKDYSERLRVTQSTVTQLAERLVRRGLVERFHDEADRRIVRLRLSVEGRELLGTADRTRRETLSGVWKELSALGQDQIMSCLETLAQTAELVRLKHGRPVIPWPGFDSEEGVPEHNGDSAQPVVDILSRRVRGQKS